MLLFAFINFSHSTDLSEYNENQLIPVSFQKKDIFVLEGLKETLAPISENYYQINSKTEWDSVVVKNLEQSTEGAFVMFYYANGSLQKIIERYYRETGQTLAEYYFMNNKISFILEKAADYNRPIDWDSTAMKENNDTQVFDINKSELLEQRNYFIDNELIWRVEADDCDSVFEKEYLLEEQNRLLKKLKKLSNLN